MKLKSLTGKRKTGKGRIAAVLALAVLLGAAPAIKTDAYPAGPYTVTLNAPSDEAYADLVNANVSVDVYKVASAVAQDGTDAYTLAFESAFKSAEEYYTTNIQKPSEPGGTGVKSDSVDTFTQTLEGIALDDKVSHGSAVIGTGDKFSATVTIADGDAGMYLLIPHGDMDDYIYKSDDEKSTYKATIANGDSKQYIFAPILITVPNREQSNLGTGYIDSSVFGEDFNYPIDAGNTANREEWDANSVSIDLKIGWKDLITKFRIVKDLKEYETMEHRKDEGTFIFSIEATKDGNKVLSDVRSIVMSADGSTADTDQEITVENIPIGAEVTVTEVYEGGDYKFKDVHLSNNDAVTGKKAGKGITFTAVPYDKENDNAVVVTFDNDYNNTWKDSGSVTNKMTRTDGEWDTPQQDYSHETPTTENTQN